MNRIFLTLVFALAFFYLVPPAHAQVNDYHNKKYDFMAGQAMRYMSDQFRFGRLRTTYMKTRQYDPIADNLIDEMLRLTFAVQHEKDREKASRALAEYRLLVSDHLANLRVVAQALSLSRLDRRFGNPDFFSWLRNGLVKDIMQSGDGKTLRGAYDVITLSEETVLLGQLGVNVINTEARQEARVYYNMHDVEDLRTGQRSTIFVNTSRPMRFLENQQRDQGFGFTIPKQ